MPCSAFLIIFCWASLELCFTQYRRDGKLLMLQRTVIQVRVLLTILPGYNMSLTSRHGIYDWSCIWSTSPYCPDSDAKFYKSRPTEVLSGQTWSWTVLHRSTTSLASKWWLTIARRLGGVPDRQNCSRSSQMWNPKAFGKQYRRQRYVYMRGWEGEAVYKSSRSLPAALHPNER